MNNVEHLEKASASIRDAMSILTSTGARPRVTVPAFPSGTVGIQLPPNVVVEVVNGEGVLMYTDGTVFTGPVESYDLTNPNGSGYADFLGAGAEGSAGIMVTPDGQIVGMAEGSAEAYLLDVSYNGSYGPLDVYGNAYVGASAEGYAGFVVDPSSLSLYAEAGGYAQVGAEVSAGASLDLGLLGEAYVDGYAQAGASVGGHVNATLDLLNGSVHASGAFDAMAGASAGFEAGVNTPLGSATVGGEVYAGAGVSGHFDAGFQDGVFTLDTGVAAALGIGAGLNLGFSLDVGNIVDNVGDGISNIGDGISDIMSGNVGAGINSTLDAVGNVTDIVSDGIDTVTGFAGGLVESGAGLVGGAFDAIGLDPLGDAAEAVGGVISSGIDAVGDVASGVVDAVGDAADAIGDGVEAVGNFLSKF